MLLRISRSLNRRLLLTSNISTPVTERLKKTGRCIATTSIQYQNTVDSKPAILTLNTSQAPVEQQIQNVVESTINPVTEKVLISEIPDIPKIPELVETVSQLYPNGEPTLESIGLGGYSPIGLVQKTLEMMHIYCHMPWWATIVAGTVIVRLLLLPIAVRTQRHAINMHNNMPQMQKLQLNMSQARRNGDDYQVAIASHELSKFMKEKQLNPLKTFGLAAVQFPVFITIILGLRRMADAPVESFKEGGLWWFTDLTIPDSYYLLPILTCVTMYISIEYNLLSTANVSNLMKYIMRAMPVCVCPFLINWHGAILCYWFSTNFFSVIQSILLKQEIFGKLFNIPKRISHKFENLPVKPKSFREGFNETWTNLKVSAKVEDKRRADAIRFNEAGKGPLRKTFKYDPTKKPPTAAEILTKSR